MEKCYIFKSGMRRPTHNIFYEKFFSPLSEGPETAFIGHFEKRRELLLKNNTSLNEVKDLNKKTDTCTMKYLLYFSTLLHIVYAKEIKITIIENSLSSGSTNIELSCKEESSIDGHICVDGNRFLVLASSGDKFHYWGILKNDHMPISNYFVKRIKSHDNTLLYEASALEEQKFTNSQPKDQKESALNVQYEKIENTLYQLDQLISPRNLKTPPSKELSRLINKIKQRLKKQKEEMARKLKTNVIHITTDQGKRLKCHRRASKKTASDEDTCGIFDCREGEGGEKRVFLTRSLFRGHRFNSFFYINSNGFFNAPKVTKVSNDASIPLAIFNYSKYPRVYGYGKDPTRLIPEKLKGQSDFFHILKTLKDRSDEGVLERIGYACQEGELNDIKEAWQGYSDKLYSEKIAQYLTMIGITLRGKLLPINKIPKTACKIRNSYYQSPLVYAEMQRVSAYSYGKSITMKKAQELFNHAQKMEEIDWEYIRDGCYARAHLMAREFENQGVYVDKAWLTGLLGPSSKKNEVKWRYHVAPVVYVRDEKGKIKKFVIDPSTFDRPVLVEIWADKLNKFKQTSVMEVLYPIPSNSVDYKRTALAFSRPHYYTLGSTYHSPKMEIENLKSAKKIMKTYKQNQGPNK